MEYDFDIISWADVKSQTGDGLSLLSTKMRDYSDIDDEIWVMAVGTYVLNRI